jgi:hypothetical protein
MAAVIEGILAVIGLVLLILLAWTLAENSPSTRPSNDRPDVAAPYQESLLAAACIQRAAWEAEQQIYAEAIRRADDRSGEP